MQVLRRSTLTVAFTVAVSSLFSQTVSQARPAQAGQAPAQVRELRIDWLGQAFIAAAQSPAEVRATLVLLAGASSPRHFVVQFSRPLEVAERERVRAAGLRLLAYLGRHAWFASAQAATLDVDGLAGLPLVGVHDAQRTWKLHPLLRRGELPAWAVVEDKGGRQTIGTYVMFHPDVAFDEQQAAVQRHGGLVRDVVQSVNGLVVELPFDAVPALADEDVVQYVEPPLPRMGHNNDSNRAITGVDTVQQSYGLDGSGVSVQVYDAGFARATHVDFGGRLTVRDSSGMIDHATHVAGTIGGDGTASSGVNRGMAPGVAIESYGFEYDGTGIFLYTNPGDFEADYADAIVNHGADVSNNSIGTNTESNGFDCSFQGDYGLMSSLIDAVVRGSVSGGVPHRIVWADGNERQGSRCDVEGFGDYYSTAPPAGAKNHLAIGALNSNDDSMTFFSSWGPTDDGRMKPDFCAPGCQSNGDFGVTSCAAFSDTAYTVFCGTSMASPTVTGIVALMLEDYRLQFPGPDPRNSTLKVLLAHSAVDLFNVGPDYQSGYGSVRAPAAIDLMRTGNFAEAEIDQGGTLFYTAVVDPSDTELKVTLAWDDKEGTPSVLGMLVNDLDLHVFSPSGVEHFPWTLDPLNPASPAVRTVHDHLNNIEQIRVDLPEPGGWRIEIRGFDVPEGPQRFSICASPELLNCGSQGLIALDSPSYGCSATAGVRVIDCDLNTDDGLIETVDVSVDSTSEPGGETVTLTETAESTAVFVGSIPLSTTDAPGVLLIAEGDTVEATYIDSDDGNGNTNVTVTASAGVDCTSPIISNIFVSNVTATGARIDFDVDEPSRGRIDFGTSCDMLTDHLESGLQTHHTLQLSGLADGQSFFFVITAEDPAHNLAIDDNSGACYMFTTAEVPDAFTEQFGPFDMSGLRLIFVPNGSLEAYEACTRAGAGFPTDPTGGTVLSLSDDDYRFVSIGGGKTVKLYGVAYSHFYVGSNGYITFTAGDTDYTESLGDHFATPRVSANFDDYNPATGGQVSWKQLPDRMAVTWNDVPEYATTNMNSFQIELFFSGRIRISYLDVASTDGLAGLSAGNGIPVPYLPSDLSEYDCQGGPPFAPAPANLGDAGTRGM